MEYRFTVEYFKPSKSRLRGIARGTEMKEAYEQFVALCKKKFGWKHEEMNTWDELSNEQKTAFESTYTFLIATNDAAGAEARFRNYNNAE